jgi:hypothetical protein
VNSWTTHALRRIVAGMALRDFWRKLTRRWTEEKELDTRSTRDRGNDLPDGGRGVKPADWTGQGKPKY